LIFNFVLYFQNIFNQESMIKNYYLKIFKEIILLYSIATKGK
jgi:hypothetical protein